ncbi:hypothetical protein [Vibrio parahaemolyticus]|uniref:hypothetical protein n=1 Tax=Vibrio parahaemolyticus TaxID=670 RepID=UPI002361A2A6|nr:hypothetical protein [Vibrio parahaemolyticus]
MSNTTTTLNYYTVNAKANSNQNRRALRIRLEAFVMFYHKRLIYLAMNCFVECILRSESHAQSHLAAKCAKHSANNSTSQTNEATQPTFNKRPLFPTKALNNGKLPRQLLSQ